MGDDLTTSFGLVQRELEEALIEAKAHPCSPEGHSAVVWAVGTEGRMIGYTYTAVRSVARETVELLRSEVVTLVHAHAEDAVKRHVERMLPAGQAAAVSRESTPGWLASVGTTLRTVGIPGAVVSVSAVVGLALWIVLEVVKR